MVSISVWRRVSSLPFAEATTRLLLRTEPAEVCLRQGMHVTSDSAGILDAPAVAWNSLLTQCVTDYHGKQLILAVRHLSVALEQGRGEVVT